jgi:glucuronoarabinoxylan endo-1,4-beta-xylanase
MAGVCTPTPKPTARVTVDVSTRYQTLVGFGASVGYAINAIAQHPQKAAIHKAMFTDLGMDVLRLRNRHGDVDNDLTTSREVADAAATSLGHKPIIILTSWSPPASLKANAAITCGGNPDTCTLAKRSDGSFDYAGYGAYWRASLDAYAEVGIVPDYISLQNNPNWVPTASSPGEACRFLPTEGTATVSVNGSDVTATYPGFAQAMAAVVGQLAGLASVPKIAAPDVTGILNVADYVPYLDFSHVDAISHHLYGTDPAAVDGAALAALGQLGESYQRPLFQTEMQSEGFETAVLMHDALAVEGASTYLQNDFVGAPDLSPNPTALIALAAESFTLQGPYHAMRHYSLHTDPGWVRVAATASVTNLLASAWTSPAGDAVTLVLVNVGFDPIDAQIQPGPQASMSSQVTRTVFAGVERSAELGAFSSDGILRVPGRAMVTVAWRR